MDALVECQHTALGRHRAGHRIHHAGELDQQPIAGGLGDAAVMPGYNRVDALVAVRLQRTQRAPSSAPMSWL